MTTKNSNAVPSRSFVHVRTNLRVHEIDGEALIYDPLTADTHRLNSTAFFVWKQFAEGIDEEEIARLVTEVYDVQFSDARIHVERVLREFRRLNLLAGHFPSDCDAILAGVDDVPSCETGN